MDYMTPAQFEDSINELVTSKHFLNGSLREDFVDLRFVINMLLDILDAHGYTSGVNRLKEALENYEFRNFE